MQLAEPEVLLPKVDGMSDEELRQWFESEIDKPCELKKPIARGGEPCGNPADWLALAKFPDCHHHPRTTFLCDACKLRVGQGPVACVGCQRMGQLSIVRFTIIERIR